IILNSKGDRPRFHQTECGLSALLHNITQLSGEKQFAVTTHLRRFDKQDIAAHRGPSETGCHTRKARSQGNFVEIFRSSQILSYRLRINRNRSGAPFGKPGGNTTANGANLAFELAHARFPRVAANDLRECFVSDDTLLRSQPDGP